MKTSTSKTKIFVPNGVIQEAVGRYKFSKNKEKDLTMAEQLEGTSFHTMDEFFTKVKELAPLNLNKATKGIKEDPFFKDYIAQTNSTTKAAKKVENQNLQKAATNVKNKRETKYNYPANLTNEEKKEFRRKARSKEHSYSTKIQQLSESADKAAKKELQEIKAEHTRFLTETYLS